MNKQKKLNENQNVFIRIVIFILIALAYLKLKIEFDMIAPFMFLGIYAIEKLFSENGILLLKLNDIKATKRIIYFTLVFICILFATLLIDYSPTNKYTMLFSILFIALYNGKKGANSKLIQYGFYAIFPIQHLVLYMLGMI